MEVSMGVLFALPYILASTVVVSKDLRVANTVIQLLRNSPGASNCHALLVTSNGSTNTHDGAEVLQALSDEAGGIFVVPSGAFLEGSHSQSSYLNIGNAEDFCLNIIFLRCERTDVESAIIKAAAHSMGRFLFVVILVLASRDNERADILPASTVGKYFIIDPDGGTRR